MQDGSRASNVEARIAELEGHLIEKDVQLQAGARNKRVMRAQLDAVTAEKEAAVAANAALKARAALSEEARRAAEEELESMGRAHTLAERKAVAQEKTRTDSALARAVSAEQALEIEQTAGEEVVAQLEAARKDLREAATQRSAALADAIVANAAADKARECERVAKTAETRYRGERDAARQAQKRDHDDARADATACKADQRKLALQCKHAELTIQVVKKLRDEAVVAKEEAEAAQLEVEQGIAAMRQERDEAHAAAESARAGKTETSRVLQDMLAAMDGARTVLAHHNL